MSSSQYRQLMGVDIPESTGNPGKSSNGKKKYYSRYSHPLARNNKKPRNMEEDNLTMQVATYLELLHSQGKVLLFSHIPQETFTKSWAVKNKNTAMGVRAGVPDVLIVYPSGVLFLELKREKGGVASEAQKRWIEALQHIGDGSDCLAAAITSGWDETKYTIDYFAGQFRSKKT